MEVTTALTVVCEVGTDMSRFPTIMHVTLWLSLCPGTKITDGKVLSGKTSRVADRATRACNAQQQVGLGRVLPQDLLTHGQAQAVTRERALRALSQRVEGAS